MSENSDTNYVKIWAVLLFLLIVSYLGPMLEIQIVTLLTAFGIAGVKAYLVAKHFMHVNHVPRFIPYLMITCLVFMLLFVAGSAPDVYSDSGDNWVKPEAQWQYMPPPAADHAAPDHH
jgi:caa(3)-type oxidase subunit IV|tara:strand:+ start:376 stop:729 length:354 start_codon:yes stop_codon:yes gene_type:complete